jgi:lipoprotein-anchoring transpeptidase ErfK/SrfK
VASVRQQWVEVYLPERPNGSVGWTLASEVTLVRNPERIVVSLASRHLELLRGSQVIFQATAAVGSPDSPTPTGQFFVTEVIKVTGPPSAYGPYLLGLSGFSNTYTSFDGGPGQIAIHGTDQPWEVGQYASHGCVRLNNAEISLLANQVETGTPVDITA